MEPQVFPQYINRSELNILIQTILRGHEPNFLQYVRQEIHPIGISNELFHAIAICTKMNSRKNRCISLISSECNPKIKIFIGVNFLKNNKFFYIMGKDLCENLEALPKVFEKTEDKYINPIEGSEGSWWYPPFFEDKISMMALRFRLLELYLRNITIIDKYMIKSFGILELEVPVIVPENLLTLDYNKKLNPVKTYYGTYIYKNKRININRISNICKYVSNIEIFAKCWNTVLTENTHEKWDEFIQSNSIVAFGSWMRHARIIVKTDNKMIYIFDPSIRAIEGSRSYIKIMQIIKEIGWECTFIPRNIRDYQPGESSCSVSAFARILFLADKLRHDDDIIKICNQPMEDLYVLLASVYLTKEIKN